MFRSVLQLAMPALACVALSGCLSHIAAREDSASFTLRWTEDFESARRIAAESGRPILVVMVAGDLRDKC